MSHHTLKIAAAVIAIGFPTVCGQAAPLSITPKTMALTEIDSSVTQVHYRRGYYGYRQWRPYHGYGYYGYRYRPRYYGYRRYWGPSFGFGYYGYPYGYPYYGYPYYGHYGYGPGFTIYKDGPR